MTASGLTPGTEANDALLWTFGVLALLALTGWGAVFLVLRRLKRLTITEPPLILPETAVSHYPELSIDSFPGSVLLLDSLGALLKANEEAASQFGDGIGAILRHPAARGALSAALRAETTEGLSHLPPVCSTTFTLDVPVARTLHVALRRIPAQRRYMDRVLVLLTDQSEARALDRMRIDFVAHASHELRTPLASLSGFIDALRNNEVTGADPGIRQQFLEVMTQQSARMKRLIDRLLYLSRVQAHEHQRPRQVVDVADLMAVVLGEVAPRFDEAGYNLKLAVEDALYIRADEDELVQVILNLIENALRYGKQDDRVLNVTLFARCVADRDDRWPLAGGVLLGVKDDGRGMASHHLPRLAERFYRVADANRVSQGTGLGLSIVRLIVDRHEGRLQISSAPNKGTTCLVWLPPTGKVAGDASATDSREVSDSVARLG